MSFNPGLSPGVTISNEDLHTIFKCGTQGGMRRSLRTNTLVCISDHTRSIYEDRWDGDIIHYTGMGLRGDQDLHRQQNRTLKESNINGVQIYLFEVFEPGHYIFQGQVELAGAPYQADQRDEEGQLRQVWVFPLKVVDGMQPLPIPLEILERKQKAKATRAVKLADDELEKKIKDLGLSGARRVIATVRDRSPYLAEYAKSRANGICQLCSKPAPFTNMDGNPFLETHHIIWLSMGGPDAVNNIVALCPNCHRKMHILDLEGDKEILRKQVASNPQSRSD